MAVERLAYMITVAKPEISDKLAQVLWIRTIGNWVVPIYLLQSIGLPPYSFSGSDFRSDQPFKV